MAQERPGYEAELSIIRDNESFLRKAITKYFKIAEGHEGKSNIPDDLLLEVKKCLEDGDTFAAVACFAENIDLGPITRSTNKRARSLRKKVRARLSPEKGMVKSPPSPTLQLGQTSHQILEALLTGKTMKEIRQTEFKLVGNGMVEKVVFQEDEDSKLPHQAVFPDVFQAGQKGSKTETESSDLIVKLEVPLDVPDTDIDSWAINIFSKSVNEIADQMGGLPNKPYDVAKIFENPKSERALVRLMEAAHIVFGNPKGMSQAVQIEGTNNAILAASTIDEYAVLNCLSIVRAILETNEGNGEKNDECGVLTELHTGDVKFCFEDENKGMVPLPVKGRVIDIAKFKWEGEPPRSAIVADLPFDTVTQHMKGLFSSQVVRYHRRQILKNGKEITIRNKPGRNLRSFFQELWRYYGDDIFGGLTMQFDDLKFPAGDGGWFTVFNAEDLPNPKHVEQMSEYIFFAFAQMAWVEKWSRGYKDEPALSSEKGWEDFSLSVGEVVDFINRRGLINNVKGRIRYQLPTREIIVDVTTNNGLSDIENIGRRMIGKRKAARDYRPRVQFLTALERLTEHIEVEVIRRELRTLPEELTCVCIDVRGRFYLSIEDFANILYSEILDRVEIQDAIYVREDETYIMWIKGLVSDERILRVAVNKRGKFAITGLGESMVQGDLLSRRALRGVSEKVENVVFSFEEHIWSNLSNIRVDSSNISSLIDSDSGVVILPTGKSQEMVRGKPQLVVQDALTGNWKFDKKLLKEAVESWAGKRDVFGLGKITRLLEQRKRGQIMCVLPGHDNQKTEAATFYGKEGHIFCHVCQTSVDLPIGRFKKAQMVEGYSVEDYRQVSVDRNKVFTEANRIAGAFAQKENSIARRYVAEKRGLDPDDDLGPFGYIPSEFSEGLADMIETETFRRITTKGELKGNRNLRLTQLAAFASIKASPEEEFINTLRKVIDAVDSLEDMYRDSIYSNLTLGMIKSLRSRGIIGRYSDNSHRWGGRLILPMKWFTSKGQNWELAESNFIARGIILDGIKYFDGGVIHHKAFTSQPRKKSKDGLLLQSTPPGFWLRDPEAFLREVDDSVIVFEGALNTASFGRIRPDLRNICLTMAGTGYKNLIATLRWLGVKGDEREVKRGAGKRIEKVIFAYDFDRGGVETFHRNARELKAIFPKIEIGTVRKLLPSEIASFIPPYSLKIFGEGDDHEGILFGEKGDLNDLIRFSEVAEKICPQTGKTYAHGGVIKEDQTIWDKTKRYRSRLDEECEDELRELQLKLL